jgi:hypothetical protein
MILGVSEIRNQFGNSIPGKIEELDVGIENSFEVGTSTITVIASSVRTYLSTLARTLATCPLGFNRPLEKTHRHE